MKIDNENKVAVPDFVADYIEKAKKDKCSLDDVFTYDSIQGELADIFLEWLFNNDEVKNEERFLIVVKAWVEGYAIEQPQKYYWRKKKKHLAWFEDFEEVLLVRKNNNIFRFGDISSYDNRYFNAKFTEQQARDLLKHDFDKFEKVECE